MEKLQASKRPSEQVLGFSSKKMTEFKNSQRANHGKGWLLHQTQRSILNSTLAISDA